MTGTVFSIEEFSVYDGPGIRTTVFMKGCPLRCAWCHNPEGLIGHPQLQYFADRCIGCGLCGDRDKLSDASCCPAEALVVCGREMEAEQVLEAIRRDRVYYANCGGVTFSGGECLLQADFVASVLAQAKDIGIHTAIDTSGAVAWSEIEKTLDVCDLYLYDVKCIDPNQHRAFTGVDNTCILQNLRKLDSYRIPIWIRVPIIPDFNETTEEMEAIADFIGTLHSVEQVTLMPYHSLGASKYPTLALSYPYDADKRIDKELFADFENIFRRHGLHLV